MIISTVAAEEAHLVAVALLLLGLGHFRLLEGIRKRVCHSRLALRAEPSGPDRRTSILAGN